MISNFRLKNSETAFYSIAVLLGALAGFVEVKVGDLLFTALLVLASCMLLGALCPLRPWRWAVVIGICVPVADWLAYFFVSQQLLRSQMYGSVLVFVPGLVGAYGGAFGRRVVDDLLSGK